MTGAASQAQSPRPPDRLLAAQVPPDWEPFLDSINIDPDAAAYVRNSGWAFLSGLVADQSVRSAMAWSLPLRLSQRTNVDDLRVLGEGPSAVLARALAERPALHRYPQAIGQRLHRLYSEWGPRLGTTPESLWNDDPAAAGIERRLRKLPGIGPKKAALGVLLLRSDLGTSVAGLTAIPLAVDSHVRRVLSRYLGVPLEAKAEVFQHAAMRASPDCPGRLSTPLWGIGVNYCRPQKPLCEACPLSGCCRAVSRL